MHHFQLLLHNNIIGVRMTIIVGGIKACIQVVYIVYTQSSLVSELRKNINTHINILNGFKAHKDTMVNFTVQICKEKTPGNRDQDLKYRINIAGV